MRIRVSFMMMNMVLFNYYLMRHLAALTFMKFRNKQEQEQKKILILTTV